MKKESLRKFNLPNKPGVYFFLKGKYILYIGKATSLKDRVKSYMSKAGFDMRGPLIARMVQEAQKIEFQVTDSVLEALILEANLIKKHQPKYNTKEKSDKSFNYVCITKSNLRYSVDNLPKVIIKRGSDIKNKKDFDKVYGPYTSGTQLCEAIKIIRRIFPFLDEKSKNYMEFYKQINLAPNFVGKRSFLKEEQSDGEGETLRRQYLQNIKNIKLFFAGKKKKILRNLQREMREYASRHEFEKAGEIKRQIFALQHINDVALLKGDQFPEKMFLDSPRKFSAENFLCPSSSLLPRVHSRTFSRETFRIEAYDIAHMGGKNMVGVMTVVEDGEPIKNEYRKFKIRTQSNTNDTGALMEVIERRFAHPEWRYPDIIVIDGGKAQINACKKILKKISVVVPALSILKDERHKPKDILGDRILARKYERELLLANSEAHRFAIAYHKKMRNRNFLK